MCAVALGVAGGTGSGKSTVARMILDGVGRDRIAFLAQDNYYKDVDWQVPDALEHHNFDHPNAIDTELFRDHLRSLKAGEPIDLPVYDFVRHRRTDRTTRIEPRPAATARAALELMRVSASRSLAASWGSLWTPKNRPGGVSPLRSSWRS